MCPVCFASAGLVAGSVISTGGVTALVARIVSVRGRKKANRPRVAVAPKEFQLPQIKNDHSKGE
jgi:hypothetical protein